MSIKVTGSTVEPYLSKNAQNISSNMVMNPDANGDIGQKNFVMALTAKGISAVEAGKLFESIDTKQTGKVSKADLESAVKNSSPPGLPLGERSVSAAEHGSSTNSNTYNKQDANKDGNVTMLEETIYNFKFPTLKSVDIISQKPGSNVYATA